MNLEYALNPVNCHAWEPEALKRKLERRFPGLRPIGRSRFVMLASLAELVKSNRKHTTIRYTPHAVEFPFEATLPLFIVKKGETHDKARPNGKLRIDRVQYKKIRDLNDRDATSDGFRSRQELLAAMHNFYGPLNPSDYVSIYHFVPKGRRPSVTRPPRRGMIGRPAVNSGIPRVSVTSADRTHSRLTERLTGDGSSTHLS